MPAGRRTPVRAVEPAARVAERAMNLASLARTARVGTPGRPSPRVARFVRAVVAPVVRAWFRPRVEGLERLPNGEPYLLVANHSGALGVAEILSFAALWADVDRPLAGFAHPFGFHVPLLATFIRGLGCVPSSHDAGERALRDGVPLLVFPGGDHEVARPLWQARRVDFAGRTGFARLAQRAGVPVVPMGIRGAHATAPVLWRSRGLLSTLFVLPRLFGVKRYGLTLLAVVGALAIVLAFPSWGPWRFVAAYAWLSSPLALLPFVPSTIVFRVGAPLPAAALSSLSPADAAARVEAAVQALVSRR
jgi:1-acyl-sn-glycerol-3-phosphate acyltransferase